MTLSLLATGTIRRSVSLFLSDISCDGLYMDTSTSPFLQGENEEREVIILLSDMVNYSGRTEKMSLSEIRNYMYGYHLKVREIIRAKSEESRCVFEPSAGDGTVAIYGCTSPQDKKELAREVVDTAIRLSEAMAAGELPTTRIGLFSGRMVEAILDNQILRFTPAFAAARRLENLCNYFQCSFLLGKELALLQDSYRNNIVKIGKVTPRNFSHVVEIFTVYKPGIHGCPATTSEEQLQQFIRIKNEAVDLFYGDKQQNIKPDFKNAKKKLVEADIFFTSLTGTTDIATRKLLQYIDENPRPSDSFISKGMRIRLERSFSPDIRSLNLAQSMIHSLDPQLHDDMEKIQEKEKDFELLWFNSGDTILAKGDQPDGIYFIVTGSVRVEDPAVGHITRLDAGELFGEAAYFTRERLRTASIIAEQDVVLRRMTGEELQNLLKIKKIFRAITQKRQEALPGLL